MNANELKDTLNQIIEKYKSFKNTNDLRVLVDSVYTVEWFERNNNLDWYYSDVSFVSFPPISLINNLSVVTGHNLVLEFLKRLDEVITPRC